MEFDMKKKLIFSSALGLPNAIKENRARNSSANRSSERAFQELHSKMRVKHSLKSDAIPLPCLPSVNLFTELDSWVLTASFEYNNVMSLRRN